MDGALDPHEPRAWRARPPCSALRALLEATPSIRFIAWGVVRGEHRGRPEGALALGDFFSRMWLVKACLPRTLPVAVTLKRFFEPEWVFILGIGN